MFQDEELIQEFVIASSWHSKDVEEQLLRSEAVTDDTRSHIQAMQGSTSYAVASMREISQASCNVNELSHTIALTVGEQSTATRLIAEHGSPSTRAGESFASGGAENALASFEIIEHMTRIDDVLLPMAAAAGGAAGDVESRDAGAWLSVRASEMDGLIGSFRIKPSRDYAQAESAS